jgi:hypothetical protein
MKRRPNCTLVIATLQAERPGERSARKRHGSEREDDDQRERSESRPRSGADGGEMGARR